MFNPNGPTLLEIAKTFLSSVEKGYDTIAPKFDHTPFRTPDLVIRAVAAHIGDQESVGALLDICCGTGAAMRIMRPLCRDRIVGIDISQGMLDVASKHIENANGKAILEFVHGSALDMPFESEFDVAVCFGAMSHIHPKDQSKFIKQVWRALKPTGRFIFATYYMPSLWSKRYWYYHGFNAIMRIRNLLIQPPFFACKLTYLLPEVKTLFEEHGFDVEIKNLFEDRLSELKLVIATRKHLQIEEDE